MRGGTYLWHAPSGKPKEHVLAIDGPSSLSDQEIVKIIAIVKAEAQLLLS